MLVCSQVFGYANPVITARNFGWGQMENSLLTMCAVPLGIICECHHHHDHHDHHHHCRLPEPHRLPVVASCTASCWSIAGTSLPFAAAAWLSLAVLRCLPAAVPHHHHCRLPELHRLPAVGSLLLTRNVALAVCSDAVHGQAAAAGGEGWQEPEGPQLHLLRAVLHRAGAVLHDDLLGLHRPRAGIPLRCGAYIHMQACTRFRLPQE